MVAGAILFVIHPRGRHIKLAANNGLYIIFMRLVHKFRYAVHITVIGNGNARHIVLLRFLDQLTDARGAVEHTELRVIMEMRKVHSGGLELNLRLE